MRVPFFKITNRKGVYTMNNKYFDFDQHMEEQDQQPVIIKIFGEQEELPASLPADLVFRLIRMQRKGQDNVDEEQLEIMATRLFGEERLEKWFGKGLTMDGLEVLLEKVMQIYNPEEQAEGEQSGKK